MTTKRSINDWKIAAVEASAQAQVYARHDAAKFYVQQAEFDARYALRATTIAQARRYAKHAQAMAETAKRMAGPQERKPHQQVMEEALELYR